MAIASGQPVTAIETYEDILTLYEIKGIEDFQQVDFLFLAHSAYVRQAAGKPTKPYDIWELGVESIEVGDYEDPKATAPEA